MRNSAGAIAVGVVLLACLLLVSPVDMAFASGTQKKLAAGQTAKQTRTSKKPVQAKKQAKKPAPVTGKIGSKSGKSQIKVKHSARKPVPMKASANFTKLNRRYPQKKKSYQPAPLPKITFSTDLEQVHPYIVHQKSINLPEIPGFNSIRHGRLAATTERNETVFFSLDPELQAYARALALSSRVNHLSMVVIEPSTGRILAMAGNSKTLPDVMRHSGFPAASLFKIITTAAALEKGAIGPTSQITFRGGDYTLSQTNYRPDARIDKRRMGVADALGKSVNPVFGRIALNYLSPELLTAYTHAFGFNAPLAFDTSLPVSRALIPREDYELSRTAAGFGDVYLNPVHAAALMAGVANQGIMPRPWFIDHAVNSSGQMIYQTQPQALRRMMRPDTARTLMQMLVSTTTTGTSRRAFAAGGYMGLSDMQVAGKTGTLDGNNPPGLHNWFIAAAPAENPRVAVAVNVVNPAGVPKQASRIGRQLIEKFFHRI